MKAKQCLHCSKEYSRKSKTSNNRWDESLFCSKDCFKASKSAAKYAWLTDKVCKYCSKQFSKDTDTSRNVWSKRKYCSWECAVQDKKENNPRKGVLLTKKHKNNITNAMIKKGGLDAASRYFSGLFWKEWHDHYADKSLPYEMSTLLSVINRIDEDKQEGVIDWWVEAKNYKI